VLAFIVAALGLVMIVERIRGHNPYALLGGRKPPILLPTWRATARSSHRQFRYADSGGSFWSSIDATIHRLVASRQEATGRRSCRNDWRVNDGDYKQFEYACYRVFSWSYGFCLWPLRGTMGIIRWSIAGMLVCLHMVMKAPVWHLITRIGSSGSAYHRYALINQTILHFWQWWLFGTRSNGSWAGICGYRQSVRF